MIVTAIRDGWATTVERDDGVEYAGALRDSGTVDQVSVFDRGLILFFYMRRDKRINRLDHGRRKVAQPIA